MSIIDEAKKYLKDKAGIYRYLGSDKLIERLVSELEENEKEIAELKELNFGHREWFTTDDKTIAKQESDIKELAEALNEVDSLFKDEFIHDDGKWYLDANMDDFLEYVEELTSKHLKGES